jgi:anti-sigma factor RsiW
MINCNDAKTNLWDYYDGACSSEKRAQVEAHLASCRTCHASLDEWVTLSQRVFSAQPVQAPPYLWTRVLAGIEAQELAQSQPWWIQWRWMSRLAVGMTLAVGLAAVYVFQQASSNVDPLLAGHSGQNSAIQLASSRLSNADDSADLALGEER